MAERAMSATAAIVFASSVLIVCAGVADAEEFRYVRNATYIEECGGCHLAFPPQLLPKAGWKVVMQDLSDHFDEDATLDEVTSEEIRQYLDSNALGVAPRSRMSEMMSSVPTALPKRITEYPAFIEAHAVIKEQLGVERFDEGFLSPCADCHRQAASALFDKELLHPGYGPSAWGQN